VWKSSLTRRGKSAASKRRKIAVLGAGGRDFHNYNLLFRNNPDYEVVAFVFTQIPRQAGRRYPPQLAGELYPDGVPIVDMSELRKLVQDQGVTEVLLAFSDLTYEKAMDIETTILSYGAHVKLASPSKTMLVSGKPVVAICGVRTGVGKSTVTRYAVKVFSEMEAKAVVIRHPMAYGDLLAKNVLHFKATADVLEDNTLTIEERGEYLTLVESGAETYAGVDYTRVLEEAERNADVIIWDGGNNDVSFIKPDLYITVADATRPGQEVGSYPGELNVLLADVVVINKVTASSKADAKKIADNISAINPNANIIRASMPPKLDRPSLIKGKRVLVVEDGPTVTHGGRPYAAAYMATQKNSPKRIVDPRPYAQGSIKDLYRSYPWMGKVLPAVGYDEQQINDLMDTAKIVPCDSIVYDIITGLGDMLSKIKPVARVSYALREEKGEPLKKVLTSFHRSHG